jgi:hypothetical protein
MGWFSRCRSSNLARFKMKKLFTFFLFIISANVNAASVAIYPPASITSTSGGWTTAANFVGQFSAASFNDGFKTTVNGRAVTMPASARLASNAGQFAVSALRLNPTALVGTAVAAWLLNYGFEWADGQWKKTTSIVGDPNGATPGLCWGNGPLFTMPPCNTMQGAIDARLASNAVLQARQVAPYPNNCTSCPWYMEYNASAGSSSPPNWTVVQYTVYGKTPLSTVSNPSEDDWAVPAAQPLPDAAASELAAKGQPLPLNVPNVQPVDLPMSDPYIDPVTGKRFKDVARLTPSPDLKTADLQVAKQEVDLNGEPVVDPQTGETKKPEEETDFCKQNPDSLACWKDGEPEEQELENRNQGTAIIPVSIGGGGSCPGDKTVSYLGAPLTISFQPICTAAGWINPIVLALAWLAAGYILIGAFRES